MQASRYGTRISVEGARRCSEACMCVTRAGRVGLSAHPVPPVSSCASTLLMTFAQEVAGTLQIPRTHGSDSKTLVHSDCLFAVHRSHLCRYAGVASGKTHNVPVVGRPRRLRAFVETTGNRTLSGKRHMCLVPRSAEGLFELRSHPRLATDHEAHQAGYRVATSQCTDAFKDGAGLRRILSVLSPRLVSSAG